MQTLITKDRGARADADLDLMRASVYAQGAADAEKDLVFGHRPTRRVDAVERQDEDDALRYTQRDTAARYSMDDLDDLIAIHEVQPANWSEHARMYSSMAAGGCYQRSTSQQSVSEDGTDRSVSIISEDDAPYFPGASSQLPSIASSPSLLPSASLSSSSSSLQPRSARRVSDGDQISYDERIEATLAGGMTRSLMVAEHDRVAQMNARQFTMHDLAYFDPQFGRELFLAKLGAGMIERDDSSSHRALTSLRMSMRQSSAAIDLGGETGTIIRQGWVYKRGEVMPSWHKRWFTLRRM